MKILGEFLALLTFDQIIYGLAFFVLSFFVGNFFKKRHNGNLNSFFEKIVVGGGVGILKLVFIVVIIIMMVFVFKTKQQTEDGIILIFVHICAILAGFVTGALYRWTIQKENQH